MHRLEKERVLYWLQSAQTTPEKTLVSQPTKRKHPSTYDRPLSPSFSADTPPSMPPTDAVAGARTPKKRKTAATALDYDVNDTPRAAASVRLDDTTSLSSASFTSDRSRRSSPLKQLARLGINPAGLEIGELKTSDERLPDQARELVNKMQDVADGDGVVDPALREVVTERRIQSSIKYKSFRPHVFRDERTQTDAGTGDPDLILAKGRRLMEDLEEILNEASACKELEQDEHGWNNLVHTPLFKAAMRYESDNREGIGYMPCTTASITPEYRIDSMTASRVDYVLYIDPYRVYQPAEPAERDAISSAVLRLQGTTSDFSINHTGFNPLRRLPICISVETKRYGGAEKKAEYQLGVWAAAQWKLLTEQTAAIDAAPDDPSGGYASARGQPAGDASNQELRPQLAAQKRRDRPTNLGDGMSQLPFLPGILVQGHEWKLVITTHDERGKTWLWSSQTFGSTQTLLDMVKIVAGLRLLMEWARGYAQWYRTFVMRI